jgi:hypothetical protein
MLVCEGQKEYVLVLIELLWKVGTTEEEGENSEPPSASHRARSGDY